MRAVRGPGCGARSWLQSHTAPLPIFVALQSAPASLSRAGGRVAAAVFLLGDRIADGLAGFFWQWNRHTAYVDDVWWPFYIGALLVTYTGFAVSAMFVARVNRHRPAMLLAYVASTFTVLAVAGMVLEVLVVQQVAVPLPHPLFYAVSTALPFYWHSGIMLVPLTMLASGTLAARHHRPSEL